MSDIPWVPEDKYKKLLWQTRTQVDAIINKFRCYGMQNDADIAVEQLLEVFELGWQVLRGKDKPMNIHKEKHPRPTD